MTTLISKAGTLRTEKRDPTLERTKSRGKTAAFTLLEVIIALAVASIALLALLRLQLTSVRMTDQASQTSLAVLLANEKIQDALASGYPQPGADSGTAQRGAVVFDWTSQISNIQIPQLEKLEAPGLRQISVCVSWGQAQNKKTLTMSTCVADRNFNEQQSN